MGKTPSPGKWIKSLLGKKSSRSSVDKGSEKLRSAKKEELVVKVKDNIVPNLPTETPVITSQEVTATETVVVPDVVVVEKQPSVDIEGDVANVNVESGIDSETVDLEEAATKVQAAVRAHQAREEFETLKGVIRLQAVIRGHLVRRQAVATYSCIWGIVKVQALVRGKKARSSESVAPLQKTNTETEKSETLQGSTYNWMQCPTKLFMIDKLLVSSPTVLPLKFQYGPEDPNSASIWLERWTQLQVWTPGPLVVKNLVSNSQTKKRSFQAVETEKGKVQRGIKKPPGGSNTGNSSSGRSTTENEKPKRTVRKTSTLGKELSRIENEKSKQSSRKSTSAMLEGSSLEAKDVKPRISFKKASLSNGIEMPNRKSAERKKETADPLQKELPVEEVSVSVVDASEDEKMKVIPETVSKGSDQKSPVPDNSEEDELKTAERSEEEEPRTAERSEEEEPRTAERSEGEEPKTAERSEEEEESKTAERNDKADKEIQEADMHISSENGNIASENTKPSDRRASLPAKIENHHQDDGLTHSGRKIPSYMAPTASAKARIRGQGSPRIAQEKPEKKGTRRHSLPPAANGKLSTMSPRAHRLLIASAKGSMNSDRSFSSSKDIGEKSTKAEWKR